MSIKVINEDDGILNLMIEGINSNIANAIRRTIIADIKSLCISDVRIETNTSSLNDEIIKQRLNLCPISLKIESEYDIYDLILDIENDTENYSNSKDGFLSAL